MIRGRRPRLSDRDAAILRARITGNPGAIDIARSILDAERTELASLERSLSHPIASRRMTATNRGTCRTCPRSIAVGDAIAWSPDVGAICAACLSPVVVDEDESEDRAS